MPGQTIRTAEERAAGLLFRESFRDQASVERGGASLAGTGTTFGPGGITLDGNGYLSYAGFSASKSFRAGATIVIEFTWGEAINVAAQKVWYGSGALQYVMFKQTSVGSHRLDIYYGGTLIFPIPYAVWSAAVVAGNNKFVLSFASGGSTAWLNGTVIGTSVAVFTPTRTSGLVVGAYAGGTTPVVGTFHRFEIYGYAATAVDEPYLRNGTLISALDNPLVVLHGKSYYKRASDSKFVTEVQGSAGITEALMGSDGLTTTQFPSIIKPRGFSFDGGDQITIPDADALSFTTGSADLPFSISMRVNVQTLAATRVLLNKAASVTSGEYSAYIDSSGLLLLALIDSVASANIYRYAPAGTIKYGVGNAVVITYDGSGSAAGIAIYRNSVRVDTVSGTTGVYARMRNTANSAVVGAGLASFMLGSITLPRIDNFALSPLQVKALTARLRRQARAA